VDSIKTLDSDLRHMVDQLVSEGIDAELVEAEVRKGSAAHKLVELARDAGADLILLSSHGKGSLAGVFLGSIALDLLKIAPCPVLVVPWMHPDVSHRPSRPRQRAAVRPAEFDGSDRWIYRRRSGRRDTLRRCCQGEVAGSPWTGMPWVCRACG